MGEADPNKNELMGPEMLIAGALRRVRRSLGDATIATWTGYGLSVERLSAQLLSMDTEERDAAERLLALLGFLRTDFRPLPQRWNVGDSAFWSGERKAFDFPIGTAARGYRPC